MEGAKSEGRTVPPIGAGKFTMQVGLKRLDGWG